MRGIDLCHAFFNAWIYAAARVRVTFIIIKNGGKKMKNKRRREMCSTAMKKILGAVLALSILSGCLPIMASAAIVDSGTCGSWEDQSSITWTLDDEGTLIISGMGDMGYFSDNLDDYKQEIHSVIIEAGITALNSWCFAGWGSLQKITIPASIESIGGSAFEECSSLMDIQVSPSNKNFTSEDGVLFNKDKTELIQYCAGKGQTSYTVPSGVIKIGYMAFFGCVNLSALVIPSSVSEIGDFSYGWFEYGQYFNDGKGFIGYPCTIYGAENSAAEAYINKCNEDGRSKITLVSYKTENGKSVITGCTPYKNGSEGITVLDELEGCDVSAVKDNVFENCGELKNVYYSSSEEKWDTIDFGVNNDNIKNASLIYNSVSSFFIKNYNGFQYMENDDKITILSCPEEETLRIPSDIDGIRVTAIGERGEDGLGQLIRRVKHITIPKTVTFIRQNTFYYCDTLIDVNYNGTEGQWMSIDIGEHNDALKNAVIHYRNVSGGGYSFTTAEITKAENDMEYIFDVNAADKYEGCIVYAALYDENHRLLRISAIPLDTENKTKVSIDKEETGSIVKLFIWADTQLPVIETKEFNVGDKEPLVGIVIPVM